MSTCTLIQSAANATYATNGFENTGNIKFYHNNVPRLGHTNEVLNLFQGTPDQQQDYIQGLLATPIILSIYIMAWIVLLWVLNCCRSKGHDWLAGKPVPLPEEPDGKKHDPDEEEMDLENRSFYGPTVEKNAYKENQGSRIGLKLGLNQHGEVIAIHVDEKGLFFGMLKMGQRIVSIRCNQMETKMNERSGDKVAEGMKTLKDSVGTLTLVVHGRVLKQDSNYAEWKNLYDRVLQQKIIFKSIVTFSLCVLFITGVVLCSAGVNGMDSAIDTGVQTLDIVEGKMRQGVEFLDDALRLSQSINNDVNSLLALLNGICPAQTNQLCSNLGDPSSCQDLNGLSIIPLMQEIISYTQADATHEQVIQDARSALDDIATQAADVDTDMDPVHQALAGVWALGFIVVLVSIFLLMVLFIPMPGVVRSAIFCLSYGFLFVIILFSFVLTLVAIPVSSAVGDVCYNDPGSRIETILRNNTDAASDEIQDVVFNIFKGCSAPDSRLEENIDFQNEGGLFGSFDDAIAQLKENAAICGTSPSAIASVETALNDGVNVHLCEASNTLIEFSDFFACRFWHPIYAQAAHKSLCYRGIDALSAITNTLFVILCMSLLIMTFRVALWDAVGTSLLGASEHKEKEDDIRTKKTEKERRGENFANANNKTPKSKRKKKPKLQSKHTSALEEGMESYELNPKGTKGYKDEGEVATGVAGGLPRKKRKKGLKKKKKTKKPSSHEEGEEMIPTKTKVKAKPLEQRAR